MTEAGWTREIKASGWYWWRLDDGQLQIVYASVGGTVSIFGVGKRSLKRLDGEFKGPITPDSFQQGRVAGLAKAVEIIKANTDVKKAIEIIRLHSLAQQAQGEKGVMDGN